MRLRATIGLALAALAAVVPMVAAASIRSYRIDVPDGSDSAFEVELRAEHRGMLVVAAEWDGPRILSFRLEGPGTDSPRERRSGPSPQRLAAEVSDSALAAGGSFRLVIRAPSGRGAAHGTLTVELPDAAEVVAERKKAAEPPPPLPPAPDPSTLPSPSPDGATAEVARIFEATEKFRALAIDSSGDFAFDACAYRRELLRTLARWRDAAAAGESMLPDSSARYLLRLAEAGRRVEELRTATDPILAGPPPSDPLRRKAWLQVRREQIRPVEQDLDFLAEGLREGHAPDLASETWPARLVACLTACERYFDERGRGDGAEVANEDLAREQWESILSALDALEAIASVPRASPGTR